MAFLWACAVFAASFQALERLGEGVFLMSATPHGPLISTGLTCVLKQQRCCHITTGTKVRTQSQKVLPGGLWAQARETFGHPMPSPPTCHLCHHLVSITPQLPPQHLPSTLWAHPPGPPCFVSTGSKNPKIALKLAEFQTDSQGKVGVARAPTPGMRRGRPGSVSGDG